MTAYMCAGMPTSFCIKEIREFCTGGAGGGGGLSDVLAEACPVPEREARAI